MLSLGERADAQCERRRSLLLQPRQLRCNDGRICQALQLLSNVEAQLIHGQLVLNPSDHVSLGECLVGGEGVRIGGLQRQCVAHLDGVSAVGGVQMPVDGFDHLAECVLLHGAIELRDRPGVGDGR
jgi:hypothetical protein